MEQFKIPIECDAEIDAIISMTFLRIRDEITQPFRTEQMRLLQRLPVRDKEHPFEGDLYQTLADEFGKTRLDIKNSLFIYIYGVKTDRCEDEDMLSYCRRKLLEQGWTKCPKKPD